MRLALLVAGAAWGHPATPSTVSLEVGATTVHVVVQVPRDQLEMALQGVATPDLSGPPPGDERVTAYLTEHFALEDDGPLEVRVQSLQWTDVGEEPHVVVAADGRRPDGGPIGPLCLKDDVVAERVRSHKIVVTLQRDVADGLGEAPRLLGVLGVGHDTVCVARSAAVGAGPLLASLRSGAEHVLAGVDHLLFLGTLLLVAPLTARDGRWAPRAEGTAWRVLTLVTGFTVGHTVTLLAAALDVVDVPAGPVEVLIALSVLLGAVHAARPLYPGREPGVAAVLGLVHGLGFASALGGTGLGRGELLGPLGAFNVGIELVQVAMVGVLAPLWWGVARHAGLRAVAAGAIGVVAAAWTGQRLMAWLA